MPIITLKNQNSTCNINTLGGQVLSCNLNSQEIFHTSQNLRRSGIPILFPFAGSLENGVLVTNNSNIQFPQHGFARDLEWEILDQDEDSVSLVLASDMLIGKEFSQIYPYKFLLCVDYELGDNCLDMRIEVTAFEDDLIISPGIHPYYNSKAVLSTNLGEFRKQESADSKVYNYQDYNLKSGSKTLQITDNNQAQKLIVWSDSPDYQCIEPWTGDFNAMNTDPIVIKKGSEWVWEISFDLVES
jgi:galactose mutarotase-like enzyme